MGTQESLGGRDVVSYKRSRAKALVIGTFLIVLGRHVKSMHCPDVIFLNPAQSNSCAN